MDFGFGCFSVVSVVLRCFLHAVHFLFVFWLSPGMLFTFVIASGMGVYDRVFVSVVCFFLYFSCLLLVVFLVFLVFIMFFVVIFCFRLFVFVFFVFLTFLLILLWFFNFLCYSRFSCVLVLFSIPVIVAVFLFLMFSSRDRGSFSFPNARALACVEP